MKKTYTFYCILIDQNKKSTKVDINGHYALDSIYEAAKAVEQKIKKMFDLTNYDYQIFCNEEDF